MSLILALLMIIFAFGIIFLVAGVLTVLINIVLVAFGIAKISIWVTFAFLGACSLIKWFLKTEK